MGSEATHSVPGTRNVHPGGEEPDRPPPRRGAQEGTMAGKLGQSGGVSGVDKRHHDVASAPSGGQPLVVVGEAARVQEPPALPGGRHHAVVAQEAAATSLGRREGAGVQSERKWGLGGGLTAGRADWGNQGGRTQEVWASADGRPRRKGEAASPEGVQRRIPTKSLRNIKKADQREGGD